MKKLLLLPLFAGLLFLAACGSSKDDADTQGEFAVASCNKYFDLMDCAMRDFLPEQKEQMTEAIEVVKQEWKTLPEDELRESCDSTWDQLLAMQDAYASLGCSME